jgi:epoxyqueuosine reductase
MLTSPFAGGQIGIQSLEAGDIDPGGLSGETPCRPVEEFARRPKGSGRETRCKVHDSETKTDACGRLKESVLGWGASLVGFADLEGAAPTPLSMWPRAVSLAVALDPTALTGVRDGPTTDYYGEYNRVNRALNEIAGRTAGAILDLGYRVEPFPATVPETWQGEDWTKTLSVAFQHKTAATRAGLGWVGKNALLITPEFGPRVRLATVLTNMPLPVGEPLTVGRCGDCTACARACPGQAISSTEWRAGLPREKLVDAWSCWETGRRLLRERVGADNAVCGVCVAVCPVGRPQA